MKRKRRSPAVGGQVTSRSGPDDELHPDATLGLGASLSRPTSTFSGDTTSVDPTDEDYDRESYVESAAALVDKHIFGKRPLRRVIAVIAIAAIVLTFVDDNRARAIELFNWAELLWSLLKGSILALAIGLVYAAFVFVDSKLPNVK